MSSQTTFINRMGLDLEKFRDSVYEDSAGKHDYNVDASQLKMDLSGNLTTKPLAGKGFNLEFTDLGFKQMCNKLEVPELCDYGRKLLEKGQTARLSSLFNYHLEEYNASKNSELWIRSKEGRCRAVFSGRYGIYDNDFLADVISDTFKDKNVDIINNSISDEYMNCRIRIKDQMINAGTKGKDDPLYMAIHVMNSEVGLSSVNLFLIVYRQVCTNGLIRQQSKEILFKQKHVGGDSLNKQDIADRLTEAFETAQDEGKETLEEFADTQTEIIDMPMENIQFLSRTQGYSQKFTEQVTQNFLEEKDSTRYGLINAFTAAARTLQDEKRIDVERFAGTLVNRKMPI